MIRCRTWEKGEAVGLQEQKVVELLALFYPAIALFQSSFEGTIVNEFPDCLVFTIVLVRHGGAQSILACNGEYEDGEPLGKADCD